ncbi:MAG: DUF7305 domain-containing protein, partial [Moorellales bacterium]
LTTTSGHTVSLGNSEVSAGIYAPTADVQIHNNLTLNGEVVGETVGLPNNYDIAYDDTLKDIRLPGAGEGDWQPVVGTWAAR